MELVDFRDRADEDPSDLCEIPNRVGNGHIRGRILSLGIVPAGIQPRVDAALHIGGQGITDDNGLLGVKIGDGGGYPVKKTLFGLGTAHLLRDEAMFKVGSQRTGTEAALLNRGDAVGDDIETALSVQTLDKLQSPLQQVSLPSESGLVVPRHQYRIAIVAHRGEIIGEPLHLQSVSCGLTPLKPLPMSVVDGGIDRDRLLALVKSAGGQTGAEGVVLGAGEVQEGVVGIEKSDGVGHDVLLLEGYAG